MSFQAAHDLPYKTPTLLRQVYALVGKLNFDGYGYAGGLLCPPDQYPDLGSYDEWRDEAMPDYEGFMAFYETWTGDLLLVNAEGQVGSRRRREMSDHRHAGNRAARAVCGVAGKSPVCAVRVETLQCNYEEPEEVSMEKDSVWVFNGARATFPSAVFSSREKAEAWIAAHALEGTLTRYPLDQGVYEWAIAQGHFTPKHARHTTAAFIQSFSSAYQEHYHYPAEEFDYDYELR